MKMYAYLIHRHLFCYHRFLAVNVGIVYLYYTFYQQVDVEQYGGIWELIKEGMMTSSALFLV